MNVHSAGLPVAVAIAVLLIGAVIHGALTDRFGMMKSERLLEFTANLESVPLSIGPWVGADVDVDPHQLERAQVTGHVARSFRHQATGETVNLFLVAGTSRNITLHTPDLCYPAAGYAMEGNPTSYLVDAGLAEPVELATSKFYRAEEGGLSQLRIFWSFSHDGQWLGPRWARSSLAGKGAIYKIYLITPITRASEASFDDNPAVALIKQAMPELQRALFPAGT